MNDVVNQAREFAITAHRRIDQRRKYTNQPYDAHLRAVAAIVETVSDDPETLAAAWLHDTLEDTPATVEELESIFGSTIANLVLELTDISRPSDGNRAIRKAIDRRHLAKASEQAKTIKLADLIDNCTDIVKHDSKFAKLFVTEASALLEVLEGGDAQLMRRAHRLVDRSAEKLGIVAVGAPGLAAEDDFRPLFSEPVVLKQRTMRLFTSQFRASDIAEPLRSFDSSRDPGDINRVLERQHLPVAGIRIDGVIIGYARRADLEGDSRGLRSFNPEQIVDGDTPLTDVVFALTRYEFCFVTLLGEVVGFISREQIESPIARMWLFGMIMMTELEFTEQVRKRWPDGDWEALVPARRLESARELQAERKRRDVSTELLSCLQYSDKVRILIQDPEALAELGFKSRRAAKATIKNMESLRNHLAHAQDIISHDWTHIVHLVQRIEEMVA